MEEHDEHRHDEAPQRSEPGEEEQPADPAGAPQADHGLSGLSPETSVQLGNPDPDHGGAH